MDIPKHLIQSVILDRLWIVVSMKTPEKRVLVWWLWFQSITRPIDVQKKSASTYKQTKAGHQDKLGFDWNEDTGCDRCREVFGLSENKICPAVSTGYRSTYDNRDDPIDCLLKWLVASGVGRSGDAERRSSDTERRRGPAWNTSS